MVFDTLYPDQAARKEQREDAQKRAEMHHKEAVRLLMGSKSGRAFVREFLEICGVFKASGPQQSEMLHYHEGLRTAGMWMFAEIVKENTENIQTIFKEEE